VQKIGQIRSCGGLKPAVKRKTVVVTLETNIILVDFTRTKKKGFLQKHKQHIVTSFNQQKPGVQIQTYRVKAEERTL